MYIYLRYPATRIWYSVPFTDTKTQWPNPNLAGQLDEIANKLLAFNQNITEEEVQRLYEIDLDGRVGADHIQTISSSIVGAWKDFNGGRIQGLI